MKITTIEPKPKPTKVIIEMTDKEACELRDDLEDLKDASWSKPFNNLIKLILDLTESW